MLDFEHILAIGSLLVGIFFSWFFTFLYFRKARAVRGICYARDLEKLFYQRWSYQPELCVSYNGTTLRNPHKAMLYVWNYGTETIDRSQIPSNDPLRFGSEEIEILKIEKTRSTRPSLNATALIDVGKKFIQRDFDYLDSEDGIAIEILYDDISLDKNVFGAKPTLLGSVKSSRSSPKFVACAFEAETLKNRLLTACFLVFFSTCTLIFIVDLLTNHSSMIFVFVKTIAAVFFLLFSVLILLILMEFGDEGYTVPKAIQSPTKPNEVKALNEQLEDLSKKIAGTAHFEE